MRISAIFSSVVVLPAGIAAQDATHSLGPEPGVRLVGSVLSRLTGDPIASATIRLVGPGVEEGPPWEGEADVDGGFQTDTLPIGTYELRVGASSFMQVSHVLMLSEPGVVEIRVEMTGVDFEVAPLVAIARRQTKLELAGFYERRAQATGHFLNREDVVARAPLRVSDLFRTVPGARVIEGRGGQGARVRLRGGCTPTVVSDGIPVSQLSEIDQLFTVGSVEGIEVYHGGLVPTRYSANTTCGVILVWSRDPGTTVGKGLTWRRALAAGGLAILIMLGTR